MGAEEISQSVQRFVNALAERAFVLEVERDDPRGIRAATPDQMACHANRGRRVEPSAQLAEHRPARPEASLDCLPKECPQMFFVIRLPLIANRFAHWRLPKCLNRRFTVG